MSSKRVPLLREPNIRNGEAHCSPLPMYPQPDPHPAIDVLLKQTSNPNSKGLSNQRSTPLFAFFRPQYVVSSSRLAFPSLPIDTLYLSYSSYEHTANRTQNPSAIRANVQRIYNYLIAFEFWLRSPTYGRGYSVGIFRARTRLCRPLRLRSRFLGVAWNDKVGQGPSVFLQTDFKSETSHATSLRYKQPRRAKSRRNNRHPESAAKPGMKDLNRTAPPDGLPYRRRLCTKERSSYLVPCHRLMKPMFNP